MNNLGVRALGYPLIIEGQGYYQFYSRGNSYNIHDKYFYTSSRMYWGMSGGPITATADNVAIGLVKGAIKDKLEVGVGVRITQQIIDLIIQNT